MTSQTLRSSLALLAAACLPGCIIHIGDGWDSDWDHDGRYSIARSAKGPRLHGNGVEATQTRSVDEFHSLAVHDSFDVRVQVGQPASVSLSGDENLLEHVATEVEDGTLCIAIDRDYSSGLDLEVRITVPDLRAFTCSGAVDAKLAGIERDAFALSASGDCDVAAQGRVGRLTLQSSGTSDLRLFDLEAREVVLGTSGDTDVQISVADRLQATLSGNSDVRYRGAPSAFQLSTSGTSCVEQE